MVECGLVESRTQAQRLIMAGKVRVGGQIAQKPSDVISSESIIEVDFAPRYVSRGGEKLEEALIQFGMMDLNQAICVDVGASTGGFTDCLLQHGAGKVYAVDVGHGILHWKLRNNTRVVVMEKTNARYLESFPEPLHLVTVDASFISLKTLLPVIKKWLRQDGGKVITLIKPQFEAGKIDVDRGDGVIFDPVVHQRVLKDVIGFACDLGFFFKGVVRSPLKGPKGNVEFLALFATIDEGGAYSTLSIERAINPVAVEEN